MKTYAVIGLGRFGTQLALRLSEQNRDVIAVDSDPALVEAIAEHVARAVTADATKRDVLENIGIADCDCAIVSIGTDLTASILTTMNLKAIGVPRIICKVRDDTHREILEKLGADEVVIPERIVADKIARSLVSPNLLEYIELSSDHGIVESEVPAAWCGHALGELNIRAKYGLNVIAIKRAGKVSVSLSAQDTLLAGDVIIVLGENDALKTLQKMKTGKS